MRAIVDVVLPVFGLILAGVLAGRFRILGQESSEALNRFVYWFALPPLLFLGMARAPVHEVANLPFLGAYLGGVAAAFVSSTVPMTTSTSGSTVRIVTPYERGSCH